jgi:PhoD-like phosphatase, N-terminal domain
MRQRRLAVSAAGAPALGPQAAAPAAPRRREDPFRLGIASGDPTPSGVVLWTRLAIDALAEDGRGGMPSRPVPVDWPSPAIRDFTGAAERDRGRHTPGSALGSWAFPVRRTGRPSSPQSQETRCPHRREHPSAPEAPPWWFGLHRRQSVGAERGPALLVRRGGVRVLDRGGGACRAARSPLVAPSEQIQRHEQRDPWERQGTAIPEQVHRRLRCARERAGLCVAHSPVTIGAKRPPAEAAVLTSPRSRPPWAAQAHAWPALRR